VYWEKESHIGTGKQPGISSLGIFGLIFRPKGSERTDFRSVAEWEVEAGMAGASGGIRLTRQPLVAAD